MSEGERLSGVVHVRTMDRRELPPVVIDLIPDSGTHSHGTVDYNLYVDREQPSDVNDDIAQDVEDVLATRPAIIRGQRLSMRRTGSRKPFSRGDKKYQSLPHGGPADSRADGRTAEGTEVRRASSVPDLQPGLSVESIQGLDFDRGRLKELRKSSRRLKERIAEHREEEERKPKAARDSLWAKFRYVKWPKFWSQLRVLLSYELWKGHMKEVEGHFGTAVVSYFIFLRWLFIMNLIIAIFWFGLVVVPQIIWEGVNRPDRNNLPGRDNCSQATCIFPDNLAISGPLNVSITNATVLGNRRCSEGNPEERLYQSSNCMNVGDPVSVRLCEFDFDGSNSLLMVASRESADSVTVVSSSDNCTDINGSTRYVQCMCNIARRSPQIEWYQYILDFVLGQGLFNRTLLFHGWYTNGPVVGNSYEMPLAFISVTGLIYASSILLLVFKMGQAYNESYVEFGSKRRVNFCNKVFTAWDFNITDPNTAKLKRVHIRTDFEEELADFEKRKKVRTAQEIGEVVVIRVATNLFTIVVLAAAGAAIFYAAQFSLERLQSGTSTGIIGILEGLVTPAVITALNIFLPFLFSFLARIERFKTQSGEIKMTLLRAIVVRLSSLIVLIITLFILIRCTQRTEDQNSATRDCEDINSQLARLLGTSNETGTTTCTECWETFIGQEFYKLGLTNFAVSLLSPLIVETFRHIVFKCKLLGIGDKIGKGNFNIPKSILDLIYTQSLLWLGFIFCPMLPFIVLFTTFLLFYVKKCSLIWNLTPDKRGLFRAARSNFLFVFLMLISLFIILVPIGVAVSSLMPSQECGPFRRKRFMYSVVSDLIATAPCEGQQVLEYFGSAGFVLPLVILLLLVIYGQFVVLRSRNARFQLVKKQLILEGANVAHIVGGLRDGAMRRLAEQRAMKAAPEHAQQPLVQRLEKKRADSLATTQTSEF